MSDKDDLQDQPATEQGSGSDQPRPRPQPTTRVHFWRHGAKREERMLTTRRASLQRSPRHKVRSCR